MKPVIIIVIAFVFIFSTVTVFAQESQISVQTDDSNYDEGDTVVISGNVTTVIDSDPVTLQLFVEGNLVAIAKITVAQDGSYSHTIIAEGPLWKKIGDYVVRVTYGEGNIAETEFKFTPKSESIETTSIFEVNAASRGTFDVEYSIKGGTIRDMIIDSDMFTIIVQIESTDEGTISLDLPREFIGAEKQDGKDDTFIILIDGIEVAYQESVVHSDSRVITINFEEGDSDIEIIGTYVIGTPRSSSYPTISELLDNSGSSISAESNFRIVPEKPNVGSSIRVTGNQFGASQEFNFYIDSVKIGTFVTDNNGHFITTMKITETQKADRVDFTIGDSQGNEKSISLRIGEIETRITSSEDIPLTVEIEVTHADIAEEESETTDEVILEVFEETMTTMDDEFTDDALTGTDTEKRQIASFVDTTKDPQYYIDRYNNEPEYKKWFDTNYPEYDSIEQAVGLELTEKIPSWVKNIFGWYAADQVSEDELLNAIKYLINEKILVVD